jgi:hypothetical protein
MRPRDVRFAAAARDDGIRKVSKFTWRAGAAGVVCSALIAVAFGHHAATSQSGTGNNGGSSQTQQPSSGSNGSGSNQGGSNQGSSNQGSGGISVPSQPPAPSSGGGQVTSGAS